MIRQFCTRPRQSCMCKKCPFHHGYHTSVPLVAWCTCTTHLDGSIVAHCVCTCPDGLLFATYVHSWLGLHGAQMSTSGSRDTAASTSEEGLATQWLWCRRSSGCSQQSRPHAAAGGRAQRRHPGRRCEGYRCWRQRSDGGGVIAPPRTKAVRSFGAGPEGIGAL